MTDERFITDDGVLLKYIGGDETAVIPDGVTVIADRAFFGCDTIVRAVIPRGVTAIGERAFMNCAWLTDITLPDTLEYIGPAAFRGCDSLEGIALPDSIGIIPPALFYECISLKSIKLPSILRRIYPRAFYGCSALTEIELPDGLDVIDEFAFEYCDELRRVQLPDSLTYIGRHAFARCSRLSDIAVPRGVRHIGSSAFYQTPVLDSSDNGLFIGGDGILIACTNRAEEIHVPEGVKRIGELAFGYNDRVRRVILPDGVTEICAGAFELCTALESVVLPDSLQVIGDRAFEDCAALASISLPDGIERIGRGAFERTSLAGGTGGLILNGRYLISHVSDGSDPQIPDAAEVIAGGAFYGDETIERIAFGGGVRSVCGEAFRFCRNLREVHIPANVGIIGEYAFSGCDRLHAYIERARRAVGESAFEAGQRITFFDGERSFTVILQSELAASTPESALFAFAAEPSEHRFSRMGIPEYLLPAAVCYADTGGVYAEYLRESIAAAVCMAVDRGDSGLLRKTLDYGFLTERQAAECAAYAIEKKAHEQQVMIMRFKQERFGSADDKAIDSRFDW